MKLGLVAFVTDYSVPITELAVAVEERGFESLFLTEHTHIPASRATPYVKGRPLPQEYSHTLDPFVALGAAAAVTRQLLLGTGICLVTERDPIVLAKEVASLDLLSAGRFLFGVGAGWNAEEMKDHGVDPSRRWAVAEDRILAMQTIWREDEATYHGKYVEFERLWSWPKPVQNPWPPLLVGGGGIGALRRVLSYGDGWMPIYAEVSRVLGARLADLRRLADQLERPVPKVTIYWAPQDAATLTDLAVMGVERSLMKLPVAGYDETLKALDELAFLNDAWL